MFNECRHILTSGHKCKAPALRGKAFCYFHTATRRYSRTSTTSAEPLLLPSTEDAAGVQLAINEVLRSYASKRIDRRQAGTFSTDSRSRRASPANPTRSSLRRCANSAKKKTASATWPPRNPPANPRPTASTAVAATSAKSSRSTNTKWNNSKTASRPNSKPSNQNSKKWKTSSPGGPSLNPQEKWVPHVSILRRGRARISIMLRLVTR